MIVMSRSLWWTRTTVTIVSEVIASFYAPTCIPFCKGEHLWRDVEQHPMCEIWLTRRIRVIANQDQTQGILRHVLKHHWRRDILAITCILNRDIFVCRKSI